MPTPDVEQIDLGIGGPAVLGVVGRALLPSRHGAVEGGDGQPSEEACIAAPLSPSTTIRKVVGLPIGKDVLQAPLRAADADGELVLIQLHGGVRVIPRDVLGLRQRPVLPTRPPRS